MKVSIVGGAGFVGSSTAFRLATLGLADEMVLIDRNENSVAIHVMDMSDVVVACQHDMRVRVGGYPDMAGSDVVIVAAAAPYRFFHSRQELVADNLPIIRDIAQGIAQFCPDAIVITATNPVETLNYAFYLLSRDKDQRKFMGYSFNDSIRFRRYVAEALGVKPSKVQAIVMGEHGDSQVPIFSTVRVDNRPVSLSESTKQDIRRKAAEFIHKWQSYGTGRSAGWMSGAGLAAMVGAIRDETNEVFGCCAILSGEYGYKGFSMGVPVILGRQGIRQILQWKLLADEQDGLRQTTAILQEAARAVEQTLAATGDKRVM